MTIIISVVIIVVGWAAVVCLAAALLARSGRKRRLLDLVHARQGAHARGDVAAEDQIEAELRDLQARGWGRVSYRSTAGGGDEFDQHS